MDFFKKHNWSESYKACTTEEECQDALQAFHAASQDEFFKKWWDTLINYHHTSPSFPSSNTVFIIYPTDYKALLTALDKAKELGWQHKEQFISRHTYTHPKSPITITMADRQAFIVSIKT